MRVRSDGLLAKSAGTVLIDPLLPVELFKFQGQVAERNGHSVSSIADNSSAMLPTLT